MSEPKYQQILLVPGFCEPHCLLWPLQYALRPHAPSVEIWQDALVFRSLEQSVERLQDAFQQHTADERPLAIITHSFGDWVVRQALATMPEHRVAALVSIAPVATVSPFAQVLRLAVGERISEVSVMADAQRASQHNLLDANLRRLVIWAAADVWVRSVTFPEMPNLQARRTLATHLTVVLQPNVHRQVQEFLAADSAIDDSMTALAKLS